jgi:hypothetical protein
MEEPIEIGRKTHAGIAKEYAKTWAIGGLERNQRECLASELTELFDAVAQRASEKAQKGMK